MQNDFVESFNGRQRDKCLNETLSKSLAHTRFVLMAWRRDYNHVRLHPKLAGQALPRDRPPMVVGACPQPVAIPSINHHELAGLYL